MSDFAEEPLLIPAAGVELRGTLFTPASPADTAASIRPERCTVIAPAMGVAGRFYGAFARYLAARGHAVLTFDYAGIGASPDRPACSLADWADHDLRAAIEALGARYPELPLSLVGHSVGGQLFGLLPDRLGSSVTRALLVASQSGYWRHWRGAFRLKMLFLWFVVTPLLVPLMGKLPKWLMGGGDIPKGVAMQWGQWGRDPEYVLGFAKSRAGESCFEHYEGPLRCVCFSDDPLAPKPAVASLCGFFAAADGDFQLVTPESVGLEVIGHFGAFRPSSEALWNDFATYLES